MLRKVVCDVVVQDSCGAVGDVDEEDGESRMRTSKARVNVRGEC